MLPSEIPDFAAYPLVYRFLSNHFDMQLRDARAMLKLPRDEVELSAGCNFATVATLCNLISGISTVLYTPGPTTLTAEAKNGRPESGARFIALLADYFPWEEGENGNDQANSLYDFVRNPLVHSLGLGEPKSPTIWIAKRCLTDEEIQELERQPMRPNWSPRMFTTHDDGPHLSVSSLYWGIFRLLQRLGQDRNQMSKAVTTLRSYGYAE